MEFRSIPTRKLSEAEKQILALKIEKVRLKREKSLMILNNSVLFFFAILAVEMIGLSNKIITVFQLNLLIILGVLVLIIGVLPYSIASRKGEKELEKIIDELTN